MIADALGVKKHYIEEYETNDRYVFAHTSNEEQHSINIHSSITQQVNDKLIDTLREQLAQKKCTNQVSARLH